MPTKKINPERETDTKINPQEAPAEQSAEQAPQPDQELPVKPETKKRATRKAGAPPKAKTDPPEKPKEPPADAAEKKPVESAGLMKTTLTHVADNYLPLLQQQMEDSQIEFNDYARKCVYASIMAINRIIQEKNLAWNSFDKSNVVDILLTVAGLELNPNATPNEVYFTTRNRMVTVKDKETGREKKQRMPFLEVGIEGDGNDRILARFGRDVKTVHRHWVVKEHDEFTYPAMNGLEVTPPKWTPKGGGKALHVVYPVTFNDDRTEYYIAERDDVAYNLLAHIANNMMNETFGICKSRWDANDSQLKEIAEIKKGILQKAKNLGLDALDDPEFDQWISPAWKSEYSREQMIIRKMRNNIVKKIPKDFSLQESAYVFAHSEEGDVAPGVVYADFQEMGEVQGDDEQKQLEDLNKELGDGQDERKSTGPDKG